FRTAIARSAAYQWEEAYAAFLALERKRLPANQRRTTQVLLASLESLLGQPQQCLDRLARAHADLASWRGYARGVLRRQETAPRAGARATLGGFDGAWRARDELVRAAADTTRSSGGPRGDYLEMMVQSAELQIAAEADRPDALPDDETLHRWVRAALGR